MKRVVSFICVFILIVSFIGGFSSNSFAAEKIKDVSFKAGTVLYKGKSEYISFSNVDNKTKVTFSSSDSSIASVSKEGKITAKKCGVSVITAKASKSGLPSIILKIKIKVLISRNAITKTYGKKYSVSAANSKIPSAVFYKQLSRGAKSQITVSSLSKTDKLSFSSSDNSVATVDSTGQIKAHKAGNTIIKATVNRSGKVFTFIYKIFVVSKASNTSISTSDRNKYYSTSAFVGSSLGLGQRNYFNSQGSGYLGNPVMLVRGCYSFANDKRAARDYIPVYKGVAMRAKDAIKKSGVDKVFINMGTNDFHSSAENTYNAYVEYLQGIRKENPKVIIFIESTTAVHAKGQKRILNTRNVKKLNAYMKEYCSKQKNMYYIDITTVMLDKGGNLSSACCSDNYVHISRKGYELWMKEVTSFTDKLMIAQRNAEDAVKSAEEGQNKEIVKYAKKKVSALKSSTFKSRLEARLKNIKTK